MSPDAPPAVSCLPNLSFNNLRGVSELLSPGKKSGLCHAPFSRVRPAAFFCQVAWPYLLAKALLSSIEYAEIIDLSPTIYGLALRTDYDLRASFKSCSCLEPPKSVGPK